MAAKEAAESAVEATVAAAAAEVLPAAVSPGWEAARVRGTDRELRSEIECLFAMKLEEAGRRQV